jgi:hypothetical protein
MTVADRSTVYACAALTTSARRSMSAATASALSRSSTAPRAQVAGSRHVERGPEGLVDEAPELAVAHATAAPEQDSRAVRDRCRVLVGPPSSTARPRELADDMTEHVLLVKQDLAQVQ